MTTPAKMALDDFEDCYTWWANGDVATPKAATVETIRAALKVLDEVQSVYAQLPETVLRDTKHRIGAEMYRDHLKQIAGE